MSGYSRPTSSSTVGVAVSLILPFPLSLGVLLLVAFLFEILRTKITSRKAGIQGIKGFYKSLSSLGSDHSTNNDLEYTPLKFYCMNCGNEHKDIICNKRGSKAVKVG